LYNLLSATLTIQIQVKKKMKTPFIIFFARIEGIKRIFKSLRIEL